MIRIDKKNKIIAHYFLAAAGLLSYLTYFIFFIWVFVFTSSFNSIVVDPSITTDLMSDRGEIVGSILVLGVLTLPYYYIMLFSRKVVYYPLDSTYQVDGQKFNSNAIIFSDEITYLGLSWVSVRKSNEAGLKLCVFVSSAKITPVLFKRNRYEDQ